MRIRVLAVLIAVLWVFPASASPLVGAEKEKAVTKAESYLNSLGTVVADFVQASSDGTVGSGRFFLKRPGKLRWQYAPPTPLLIVANGKMLSYQDFELDQVSHVPSDSTLAGFLARETTNLRDPKLTLTLIERDSNVLRVGVQEKGNEDQGALVMVFDEAPMQLKKLEVTDATGRITHITFSNLRLGEALDNKLFYIDETKRFESKKVQ